MYEPLKYEPPKKKQKREEPREEPREEKLVDNDKNLEDIFIEIDTQLELTGESPKERLKMNQDVCYRRNALTNQIITDEDGNPLLKEIVTSNNHPTRSKNDPNINTQIINITTHGSIICTKPHDTEHIYIPHIITIPEGMTVYKFTMSAEGTVSVASFLDTKYYISIINNYVNELLSIESTPDESIIKKIFTDIIRQIEKLRYDNYRNSFKTLVNEYRTYANNIEVHKFAENNSIDIDTLLKPEEDKDTICLYKDFVQHYKKGYNLFKLTGGDKITNKIFSRKIKEKNKNNFSITEINWKLPPLSTEKYGYVKPQLGISKNTPYTTRVQLPGTTDIITESLQYDKLNKLPDLLDIIEPIDKSKLFKNIPPIYTPEIMDGMSDEALNEYVLQIEEYEESEIYKEYNQLITLENIMSYYAIKGIKTLIIFDFACSVFMYEEDGDLHQIPEIYNDLLRECMHELNECKSIPIASSYEGVAYGGKNKNKSRKNKSRKNKSRKNKSRKNKNKK